MGPSCPPNWTFAARAAYFGERMCAFCGHRNPAGAKFCNDCASPLQLKPCERCNAVNDQAATSCYKCGAAYPVSFNTPEATRVLATAERVPAWATPRDAEVAATTTQPRFVASSLRAGWRLLRPGQLLAAAIATIAILGAYDSYRSKVATPDAMPVASQPIGVSDKDAIPATPAVPAGLEGKPVEPEATPALQASMPAANAEAPKRASVRRPTVPAPITKHASAHQRPVPRRQPPVGATPPAVAHGLPGARVGARVAQTSKALPPDPWQVMRVSLANCGGDLMARIVCGQRVRRHFCEGHWGEAPHCASGVANDHGQ